MPQLKIPKETHLSSTGDDKYGFAELSRRILDNVLLQMELPNCFGLYGNWGSGKSTVLHFIQEHLKSDEEAYQDITTVYFEPWKYEYAKENDLLFALLHKILNELDVSKKETRRNLTKMLLSAASWGTKTVSSALTLGTATIDPKEVAEHLELYEDLLSDKYNDWIDDTEQVREKIQEAITEGLAKKNKKRLLIFIDDLDRCLPENAIRLLEGIKNYLSFESTLFILAIDKRVVSEMIEQKYNLHTGYGNEYLMKIIHYYYQLPNVDSKDTVIQIVESYGMEGITESNTAFMASFLRDNAGEPRRAKHFLHQFLMRVAIGDVLDSLKMSADFEYDFKYLFIGGFLLERFPTVFATEDRSEKLRNLRDSTQLSKSVDGKHQMAAETYKSIPTNERKMIEKILKTKVARKGQNNPAEVLDIEELGNMMRLLFVANPVSQK